MNKSTLINEAITLINYFELAKTKDHKIVLKGRLYEVYKLLKVEYITLLPKKLESKIINILNE